jgi:hypothetical protein
VTAILRAMFERFTERARQVVVLGQEESRTLKHNYIGAEHLLLGLIREQQGVAARVLESFDITLERVRPEVVRLVGEGQETRSGEIPFRPAAKKAFELSLREAQSLGDRHIDTEHLLLGILRESTGVVARIIDDLDADAEKIRNEVLRGHVRTPPIGQRRDRGQIDLEVDGPIEVGLTPRARQIWMSAAAQALDAGRTKILPGDLLEALISDETVGLMLTELDVDARALLERLKHVGWTEPDGPEQG